MLIAAFSDIHGHFEKLRAVIADAERRGARHLLCCGDIVGRGPDPETAVRLLIERGVIAIRGNVDEKALAAGRNPAAWTGTGAAWVHARLSTPSVAYLERLPQRRSIELDGCPILLAHGSPRAIDASLTPEMSEAALDRALAGASERLILCGHTHRPMIRISGGRLVVNLGSVGRPRDGDPRPSYALIELVPRAQIIRIGAAAGSGARPVL